MSTSNLVYTTFYIVRHGQTVWNVEERLQGHTDNGLDRAGLKQAADVAEALATIHFDAVYASDLRRAVQTAEIIAKDRALTVETSCALREKGYGSYEGRKRQEVQHELRHLFDRWETLNDQERMRFRVYEGGESDHEAVERFMGHLSRLAVARPGRTLLVVSHGGVMRYLLIKLGWSTYDELAWHFIPNTAYIIVEGNGVEFRIRETPRIEKA